MYLPLPLAFKVSCGVLYLEPNVIQPTTGTTAAKYPTLLSVRGCLGGLVVVGCLSYLLIMDVMEAAVLQSLFDCTVNPNSKFR